MSDKNNETQEMIIGTIGLIAIVVGVWFYFSGGEDKTVEAKVSKEKKVHKVATPDNIHPPQVSQNVNQDTPNQRTIAQEDNEELSPEKQKKLDALIGKMGGKKNKPKEKPSSNKIADVSIKLTTDGMKMDYPGEVLDAAVTQKDNELSLVLIVRRGTSVARAKELGDNFLRQVMANSGGVEKMPKKEIGPTRFHYLIGIYGPGEKQIALGAKSSAARSITW